MTTKLSQGTDECGPEVGARSPTAEKQCLEAYHSKEKQASKQAMNNRM